MARKELFFKLWIGAAVVMLFGVMYFLTLLGPRGDGEERPRGPQRDVPMDPMLNPALQELRRQVDEKVALFLELTETGDDIEFAEPIEQALAIQRRIINERGTAIAPAADLQREDELTALRDEFVGGILTRKVRDLVSEAEILYRREQFEEARSLLQDAIKVRQDIDRRYGRSSHRNPSETRVLVDRLDEWNTRPLLHRSQDLREEAFQALDRQEWETARNKMQEALALQQELFENHRDSRLASISRLRAYERDWDQIQAAELESAILRSEDAARQQILDEDWSGAAENAEAALSAFNQLERRVPRHRLVRENYRGRLESLRETTASATLNQELQFLENMLRTALQSRNAVEISRRVGELYRIHNQFRRQFPNSAFYRPEEHRRITFLNNLRLEIPLLQEMIDNRLREVPGRESVRLLEVEVWQDLFEKVMNENPSSHKGALLPVESVTWQEAEMFCRRMGWILGQAVSLPEREVFRSALGDVVASAVAVQSVNSQNSDRVIAPIGLRAPNRHGFQDLLGNVAEWISGHRGDKVIAIGGSARDNPVRLAAVPEEEREPDERNRFIGFRFQVR